MPKLSNVDEQAAVLKRLCPLFLTAFRPGLKGFSHFLVYSFKFHQCSILSYNLLFKNLLQATLLHLKYGKSLANLVSNSRVYVRLFWSGKSRCGQMTKICATQRMKFAHYCYLVGQDGIYSRASGKA